MRGLGRLDSAIKRGELFLGHLLAAQKRVERTHQEHLDTDKLGEDVHLHLATTFSRLRRAAEDHVPIRADLAICLGPVSKPDAPRSGVNLVPMLCVRAIPPLMRRKPSHVSLCCLSSCSPMCSKLTRFLAGTGISLSLEFSQCVRTRNQRFLSSTLSGVECHSSSGAKHRRRSTPELNAESRLHRPH